MTARLRPITGWLVAAMLLVLASGSTGAQDSMPELPLPQETIASEQPAPSAHLFLRELYKRQSEWYESKGRYTMLANLFPAVLEQEGVVYNMEANGEWLLQNDMLVFQVLDDYRRDFDVLAWEQDRVWGINSSGEIGSRSRIEMDEIARELLAMVDEAQEQVYGQARSYFSLADMTRNNILPAESFRPIYTSLGYQVSRPAQGVLLLHRAGRENNAQRNLWYGAVSFGGSCAWLQESGSRMRILPYMDGGADGVENILRNALKALVAAQNRYKGAYQHYGSLEDLSGLYFERLDFSGEYPESASGINYSFSLDEDELGYSVVAGLNGTWLRTDERGEISQAAPAGTGEGYLPLPGGGEGFIADEGNVEPAEGLDQALLNARIDLVSAVLNHLHNAQEAHLLRHGHYADLQQLEADGLLDLDSSESGTVAVLDGVDVTLELDVEADQYRAEGVSGDVRRVMDETGTIREVQD